MLNVDPEEFDELYRSGPYATLSSSTVRQYYGLNSAEAAMLSVDLEKWLRITVTPTIAWDYPTIEAAAGYLSDQTPAEQPEQTDQAAKT